MAIRLFGFGKKKGDIVFDLFKKELEKQGLKIDKVDETELIDVKLGELTLRVSLDNLRKNYERDKDENHIKDFVQTLVSYNEELPSEWEEVKRDIYVSLFPNDFEFNDFIHHKVTDEFSKVYIHSSEGRNTWLSSRDLETWNITVPELVEQANLNADRLLAETVITFQIIEDRKLGLFELEHETLKGALLFAPALKQKISADFGFPFYAVIPVRDFCYLFSEKDLYFFAERIGRVVVDEYKQSGYPVTTEILKFSDDGVEAEGKYPLE